MEGDIVIQEQNQRINWIDIARGIGIILVVFGHTWRENLPKDWLYSFHMPLFFFISGWLVNIKKTNLINWKNFLIKKFLSLIVPYVLFILLTYLYWSVIESHFREFDEGPLWFLLVLFVSEIIVKLLSPLLVYKIGRILCLLVPLTIIILVGLFEMELPNYSGGVYRSELLMDCFGTYVV